MRCTRIMLFQAVVCGLMVAAVARAQPSDSTGEVQELTKDIKELKNEITSLKNEVKKMRGDIAKAVAAMKSAGKKGRTSSTGSCPASTRSRSNGR